MDLRKILFFFVLSVVIQSYHATKDVGVISKIEEKLEYKFSEVTNAVAKWLEEFNDKNLGNSELGRWIHYNSLKPKFGEISRQGKSMKKMSMALLPLVFHVGATSTWMLLTSIMAAKSVAIGLALLVFKIAVSSAKVASFFTLLKSKHHHHDWSWNPHVEHGHIRGFKDAPYVPDWGSHGPEVIPSEVHPYKTIPTYKSHEHEISPFDDEYTEQAKKHS